MTVIDVARKYEGEFYEVEGVVGVVPDVDRNVIIVLVENVTTCSKLPKVVEGYPVECRVVGKVRPL